MATELWTFEQHGDFLDIFPVDPGWGYGVIARIENSDIDPPGLRQQAKAHARLIAAAPELLEALEMLRGIFEDSTGGGWILRDALNIQKKIELAEAAIRKAKGE